MKRKELINMISAVCLCTGVLSGCSDKEKNAVSSEKEIIIVPETTVKITSATEETTALATEAPTEAVTQPEVKTTNALTYSIDENGIELIVDGESTQYISLGYETEKRDIVADDFDFDGYKDIFIPAKEYGGIPGTFYRYIPDSKQFEPWDELNKIGRQMTVYNGEPILVLSDYSQTGSRYTYYKWNNEVLEKVSFKDVYFSNYEISDYYEYSADGSKVLVKRELRNCENNALLKTLERDELVYFSVEENGIEVFRDGEVIQTIEGNYAEIYAPIAENSYYTIEDAIYKMDYDFDYYLDVFIPDDISYNSTGKYYRYDPNTGLLEEWNELNKLDSRAYASRKKTINVYQGVGEEFCTTAYQWDNGTLKAIGYRVRGTSDEDGKSTVTDYTFDENGEKVFSESYEAGEAPAFYE